MSYDREDSVSTYCSRKTPGWRVAFQRGRLWLVCLKERKGETCMKNSLGWESDEGRKRERKKGHLRHLSPEKLEVKTMSTGNVWIISGYVLMGKKLYPVHLTFSYFNHNNNNSSHNKPFILYCLLYWSSSSYLSLQTGLLAPKRLAAHPNSIWGHPGPKAQVLHSEMQHNSTFNMVESSPAFAEFWICRWI